MTKISQTCKFSAGALVRESIKQEIIRSLDDFGMTHSDFSYTLKEYPGLLDSDFTLVLMGHDTLVNMVAQALVSWMKRYA